jgi:hypothetical protein
LDWVSLQVLDAAQLVQLFPWAALGTFDRNVTFVKTILLDFEEAKSSTELFPCGEFPKSPLGSDRGNRNFSSYWRVQEHRPIP